MALILWSQHPETPSEEAAGVRKRQALSHA